MHPNSLTKNVCLRSKTTSVNLLVFFVSLLFFVSCSKDNLQLNVGEVAIRSITPNTKNDYPNPDNNIALNYAIDLNLNDASNYAYLLYRTVSKLEIPQDRDIDHNKLIHHEVIKKGLVKELAISETNPNQRTLPFSYNYNTKDDQVVRHSTYTVRSKKSKVEKIDAPINIALLTTGGFNVDTQSGSNILQDIGLIVYKVPLTTKAVDPSLLDYSQLFVSMEYRNYLKNGASNHRLSSTKMVKVGNFVSSR